MITKKTGPYAVEELITDEKYKDWKIKGASSLGNSKSAEMDCAAKLSSLWKIINGDLDNRQTHQTKADSSIDLDTDREKGKKLAELHRMVQGISSSDY